MVGLYIDDSGAEDIRPTKDIDLAFRIFTLNDLERLREQLNRRGFWEAVDSQVICRFQYEDLWVDVRSVKPVGWAFGNRWFLLGFDHAINVRLDDIEICILSLPFFLASKFDAFFERGIKDVYASTDLEDILYLIVHTSDFLDQVSLAPAEAKTYLAQFLHRILNKPEVLNAITGHLFFDSLDEELKIVHGRLNQLSHLS